MPIDTTRERVYPLAKMVHALPRRRAGRKTAISTLYRWSKSGCRGVVLETIQVGATRCTSREALQRFFERLSEPSRAGDAPSIRTANQRQRDSEAAAKQLEDLGA